MATLQTLAPINTPFALSFNSTDCKVAPEAGCCHYRLLSEINTGFTWQFSSRCLLGILTRASVYLTPLHQPYPSLIVFRSFVSTSARASLKLFFQITFPPEIPFGAKESTFLAPASLEQTTGMFSLNPELRAHLHLGRNFAFSICLFTTGRMLAKWGALFPVGGFADKPSRFASLAASDGALPVLLVSSRRSQGVHVAACCWLSCPDGFPPSCPVKMHQQTDLSAALLSTPHLQSHQHPVNIKTCRPLPLGMVPPHSPSLIPQPHAFCHPKHRPSLTIPPRPSLPCSPPHILHPTQPQPPSSAGCSAGRWEQFPSLLPPCTPVPSSVKHG